MKITQNVAASLRLALVALFGLSACKTGSPSPPEAEREGQTRHVHKDGSVHYH